MISAGFLLSGFSVSVTFLGQICRDAKAHVVKHRVIRRKVSVKKNKKENNLQHIAKLIAAGYSIPAARWPESPGAP